MLLYSRICTKFLALIKPEAFIFLHSLFVFLLSKCAFTDVLNCILLDDKSRKSGQFHSSSHHINKSASVSMERM